jgi:TolB-like protein/Flp pilus assembly protein TadD
LSTDRVERRLTAILAADVAGYSRLMGADDEGTLAQLKAHRRALVDPKIAEHRGRIVKTTGDGLLVEFASVVDALRCAVDIQRGMAERNAEAPQEKRIEFRVGINVGDIIIDGDDIYGNGVNVAARLEGLAEAGGICVSSRVQEDARGKLEVAFEDVGEQQLKNIERPVRVYRVRSSGVSSSRPALPLPDKPSIAVLPFNNMSGDPEQEYFADGVVEDIITALSRMRWLFVIARNSSFTYKGRAVDVKQVSRELGVRYILEGSVRKAANRVRITGQLIDSATSAHLWADRFDGALEDVFDLQDQVTASVVGAIGPKLEQAEIERSKRKPTGSLDAYDYFLRGVAALHQFTREGNNDALNLFYKAIELDPEFAAAYGLAARCYAQRLANGWIIDRGREIAETDRLARRAAQVGKDDAVALCGAGLSLALVVRAVEDGAALIERALVLNPNLATAWHFGGLVAGWLGKAEEAIEHFARAMRLSPLDPLIGHMQTGMAFGLFFVGRHDEAAAAAAKATREAPNWAPAYLVSAASAAFVGRTDEARSAVAKLLQLALGYRVSNLGEVYPLHRPEDLAKFEEGLRKAGLPE